MNHKTLRNHKILTFLRCYKCVQFCECFGLVKAFKSAIYSGNNFRFLAPFGEQALINATLLTAVVQLMGVGSLR